MPRTDRTTTVHDRTDTAWEDRPADRRRRAARPGHDATRGAVALLAAVAFLLAACSTGGDATAPDADAAAPLVAEIDGRDLVLRDGDERTTLASLDVGEFVHVSVRPGDRDDDAVTVLALTRLGSRYELRYVTRTADATTELYAFPTRMQVDPETTRVVDVPTVPVWAPDGSAIAWLEWGTDGTRLRTVGWRDHDAGTNPSDDKVTYRLDEVPAGSQLEAWEVDGDGTALLAVRTDKGERWCLRLEPDGSTVAVEIV